MGGGSSLLSVLTALTISGCTFLALALFLSWRAHEEEAGPSTSSSSTPSPSSAGISTDRRHEGIKKKKKTVRFSEGVEDPAGSSREYRTVVLLGGGERTKRAGGDPVGEPQERREKKVAFGDGGGTGGSDQEPPIPGNRRVLYQGLCQYRSQRATLMFYHA
uniref:DNA-directed RNA polymerase subunit beta n=1 Tax=Anthurium amnicola TaxID=1678845 RepID=A0A1D1YC68_9ARAE